MPAIDRSLSDAVCFVYTCRRLIDRTINCRSVHAVLLQRFDVELARDGGAWDSAERLPVSIYTHTHTYIYIYMYMYIYIYICICIYTIVLCPDHPSYYKYPPPHHDIMHNVIS